MFYVFPSPLQRADCAVWASLTCVRGAMCMVELFPHAKMTLGCSIVLENWKDV